MKIKELMTEAVKQRLDAKCWKGKHKEGTKIKGGVRVNNCVPNESVTEGRYTNRPNHVYDILKYALADAEKTGKKVVRSAGGYYKLASLDDPNPALDHNYDRPNQIAKLKAEIDRLEQIRLTGFSNPAEYKKLYYRKYGPHYKGPGKLQTALKKQIADIPYAVEKEQTIAEDWNKVNKQDKTDGLSQKAVNAYRRENPGSKLKTAVTTKPSKLKPGSKAAKRRKSFCARMSGNKGPMKKPNGKPTPKALALRRWNCESVEQMVDLIIENMDHAKDNQAVPQLKAALLAQKTKLQKASDEDVYDIIDTMMTRIAKTHGISGQKLHDMWVDQYDQVPDTWIMK